ncbi:protein of unknown function [Candidatus Bipolaricaulis anaerobius]|uniref:Uncharacterized protein n=1 Tax=Candidatus Bipolaricaulis anaerobius TaxID=2026885 RepID=A0A2X3K7R7_9BACT|nr:protein of unknown function [Candidatus Bipolaricaulis anaerobius]
MGVFSVWDSTAILTRRLAEVAGGTLPRDDRALRVSRAPEGNERRGARRDGR